MIDDDMKELTQKLDHLTELITSQVSTICQDVRELQVTSRQYGIDIKQLFSLADWIPRLQGAVALLVVLVPIVLWLASQKR